MRPSILALALLAPAFPAVASAHHAVSTTGIAWVEPLTVAEVDVDAASFDFGGELRGDWQTFGVRAEVAPTERFSASVRVPWAHLHLADGRHAVGLSDIEGTLKLRMLATEHGGLIASAGLGAGLPTGQSRYGLGAGHFEIAPFVAASAQPNAHLILDAIVADKVSVGHVGGGQTTASASGLHGPLIAPHADHEAQLGLGIAGIAGPWYARVGTSAHIAWASPMDGLDVTADLGFARPEHYRISLGGAVPAAGFARYRWRTQLSVAAQFH